MKLHNASNSRCNCLLNFIIMFITDFSLLGWTLMNSWCISPIPFRSSDGGVVCGGCKENSFEETQVRCTHCTSEDADYQLLGIFTSLVSDRWLITFVGRIAYPAEQCAFNSYIHITPQSICSRIGRSDSCRVLYWTWFHNYCDLTENNQWSQEPGWNTIPTWTAEEALLAQKRNQGSDWVDPDLHRISISGVVYTFSKL